MLAVALLGLGVGVIGSVVFASLGTPWARLASSVALWAGLSLPVITAFVRARPPGLLRLRSIDLLWGIGFGGLLRLIQGWLGDANGTSFPAAPAGSSGAASWWFAEVLPAAVLAPVIEEFLFRGVILVVVYQLFRRSVGHVAAGVTALLVSSGGFVILHAGFGALGISEGVQFFVLGATCSLLVLLTGRIWGAVLTHLGYNVTYVVQLLVGTAFS